MAFIQFRNEMIAIKSVDATEKKWRKKWYVHEHFTNM